MLEVPEAAFKAAAERDGPRHARSPRSLASLPARRSEERVVVLVKSVLEHLKPARVSFSRREKRELAPVDAVANEAIVAFRKAWDDATLHVPISDPSDRSSAIRLSAASPSAPHANACGTSTHEPVGVAPP